MRQLCEIVSVTYGEFQSWYNYGELRLTAERVIHIERTEDEIVDSKSPHTALLMERLPQLSLEDEEGVLIVQLAPTRGEKQGQPLWVDSGHRDPLVINISIDRIQRVIPLTERARRILEPRLSVLGVKLEPPRFHEQVRFAWFERGIRRALRGGDALAGVYFEEWSSAISNELRRSINGGIWVLDHKDDLLTEDISEKGVPGHTWIPDAFTFTRYRPYNKGNGEVDYLLDAGVVLKGCAERQQQEDGFLEQYRNAAKSGFSEKCSRRLLLPEILGDMSFMRISEETQAGFPDAFPASLGTLVAFLHWKDLFHKEGEQIGVIRLAKEMPEFVNAIGFEATVAAVWLFGCFAGYERVVPAVYATDAHTYPWYSGLPLSVEKINRPDTKEPSESAAPVPGADSSNEAEKGSEITDQTTEVEASPEDLSKTASDSTNSPEAEEPEEPKIAEEPAENAQVTSKSPESVDASSREAEFDQVEQLASEGESEIATNSNDQQDAKCESPNKGKAKGRSKSKTAPQKSLVLHLETEEPSNLDVSVPESDLSPDTAEASKGPDEDVTSSTS